MIIPQIKKRTKEEAYFRAGQTPITELFEKNSSLLLAVNYFRKKHYHVPSRQLHVQI